MCVSLHSMKGCQTRLRRRIDEFGQWKPIRSKFDDKYLDAYHKHVGRSAPQEDYVGRLDLYKLSV